jgi:hypothetical protein
VLRIGTPSRRNIDVVDVDVSGRNEGLGGIPWMACGLSCCQKGGGWCVRVVVKVAL